MRRDRDIELVLQWAYRDELPKSGAEYGGRSGMAPMFAIADLGVRVDEWHREPGFPAAMGETDPGAFVVDAAVRELRPLGIEWPAHKQWLVPDCAGLLDDDDFVLSAMSIDPIPWVVSSAVMGRRPDWAVDWHVGFRPHGVNGMPTVIDRRRIGARCPLDITPDARGVVADRAIYVAWHQALAALAEALFDSVDGRLSELRVLPPACSARPWVEPDPVVHIFRDVSPGKDLGARPLRQQPGRRRRRG